MNNTVLFSEEEKRIANETPASAYAEMYDAGQLKHGLVIADGKIIGREKGGAYDYKR